VGSEPTWRFRNDEEDNEHWDEEDTLENTRDAPGEGLDVRLSKTVVDPVGEEDAKVESRELHANIFISVRILAWRKGDEEETYTSHVWLLGKTQIGTLALCY
jgi:hypothetical protein